MNSDDRQAIQFRFQTAPTAKQWERVGYQKRAGVAVPLFSIFSESSQGIGDFFDLRILADWCQKTGMSIIQLLPLNDVGFNFMPYDAVSMFALEPMYLSLHHLMEVDAAAHASEIKKIKKTFPTGGLKVNYGIKAAKLEILKKMHSGRAWDKVEAYRDFQAQNRFWLEDYALFNVIKRQKRELGWENWEPGLRNREDQAMRNIRENYSEEIDFQIWLQWQAAAQLQAAREYARELGVFFLGDIPLLVSRDSADVWAHQNYFKLEFASGAPPDAYAAQGQRWGMPPYHWDNIAAHGYDYLTEKLKYANRFYDLFRIDHFVGVFRLWTIPVQDPLEFGGQHGRFDPPDEQQWEEHGRRLVQVMLSASTMLPCAEDLGVIPGCSYKIIDEQGLLGMDIQRWNRYWEGDASFKPPEAYRLNSMAVISTHDMSSFQGWWQYEAGTVDEIFLRQLCQNHGYDFEWMRGELFETAQMCPGRLQWKSWVDSLDKLLAALGRRREEVKAFVELYNSSFFEKNQFWNFLGLKPTKTLAYSARLAKAALKAVNHSRSVFSIQLLQDWLGITRVFEKIDFSQYRINFPGTVNGDNWTLTMPFSLEELLEFDENVELLAINRESGRTDG